MVKKAIGLSLIVIVVVGLGFLLKTVSPTKVQPNPNIVGEKVYTRSYSHMTGKADAKVTFVEFGDYECPYCAQVNGPVQQIVSKYKADPNFNFVFRHFPLSQHPNALPAAEAAEAAGAQGKFFEMSDLIFEHQNDWASSINPTDNFVSYAQQLGLDVNKFKSEITVSTYINNIAQDQADGNAFNVQGTPTFFLNGQVVEGLAQLDSQIQALLSK